MYYKKNLASLRKEKGLKQNDIAKVLKMTGKSYSSYEIEHDILPIKHLNTLANFFDVSIDYLFDFTNERKYLNSKKFIKKETAGKRLKAFRKNKNITQSNLAIHLILLKVYFLIMNVEDI